MLCSSAIANWSSFSPVRFSPAEKEAVRNAILSRPAAARGLASSTQGFWNCVLKTREGSDLQSRTMASLLSQSRKLFWELPQPPMYDQDDTEPPVVECGDGEENVSSEIDERPPDISRQKRSSRGMCSAFDEMAPEEETPHRATTPELRESLRRCRFAKEADFSIPMLL